MEGRQEGRQEGRREGRQEGRREGQMELVLSLLEERFAPVPKSVIRKVRTLAAKGQLNELAKRVLVASSLDELGLS